MEVISPAASAYANSLAVQGALNIVTTLGLFAHLNPYDGCVLNNTNFDYIIVGGGTSGCVIANRLTEDKRIKVLVIEAGDNFDIQTVYPNLGLATIRSPMDWNFTAEPDANFGRCHKESEYRPNTGKVLGGTSSVDFILHSQGSKRDYDSWANITNEPSWSYTNVLRLFKKIENLNDSEIQNSPDAYYHGFNGNVGLIKDHSPANEKYYAAYRQIGMNQVRDLNERTPFGLTGAIFNLKNGIRQNSALAYLTVVRQRENLNVMKNSQVTKILFNKQKRAKAVVVVTKDKRTFVFKTNREIIIAAGTFNTPKLLQLSGIGPKDLLNSFNIPVISDVPVGSNYQTHQATMLVAATTKTSCKLIPENNNPGHYSLPSIISAFSINTSDSIYDQYRTLISVIPVTPPTAILTPYAAFYRFKDYLTNYWYTKLIGREMMCVFIENTKVASRGEVRIRSTDPFDPPIIDAKYYSEEVDVENMVKYAKDCMRIFDSPYFKEIGALFIDPTRGLCGDYKTGGDDYWRCYVRCVMAPLIHHSGTAAMGTVVDGRLRVKRVRGLRVGDASVMPDVIDGSTTIPTMMIGENLAEMIKEDYLYS